MTRWQKAIIALFVLGDIAVIAALAANVAGFYTSQPSADPGSTSISSAPSADRYAASTAVMQRTCAWQAAQLMAYTNLDGTAVWTPADDLRFDVVYPLANGQSAGEAEQAVWTVFDIALELRKSDRCADFDAVAVAIQADSPQQQTAIAIRAQTADLVAYAVGALDEQTFIEHVDYSARSRAIR